MTKQEFQQQVMNLLRGKKYHSPYYISFNRGVSLISELIDAHQECKCPFIEGDTELEFNRLDNGWFEIVLKWDLKWKNSLGEEYRVIVTPDAGSDFLKEEEKMRPCWIVSTNKKGHKSILPLTCTEEAAVHVARNLAREHGTAAYYFDKAEAERMEGVVI